MGASGVKLGAPSTHVTVPVVVTAPVALTCQVPSW